MIYYLYLLWVSCLILDFNVIFTVSLIWNDLIWYGFHDSESISGSQVQLIQLVIAQVMSPAITNPDIAKESTTYVQFIHSFIHSFNHSIVHSFIQSLIHWFIHSFIQSFNRSFIHSIIDSLIHWFIHWLIDSFIRSFIHSFVHLFHSLISFTHYSLLIIHSLHYITLHYISCSFHSISFHFISFHFIPFQFIPFHVIWFIHSINHFVPIYFCVFIHHKVKYWNKNRTNTNGISLDRQDGRWWVCGEPCGPQISSRMGIGISISQIWSQGAVAI